MYLISSTSEQLHLNFKLSNVLIEIKLNRIDKNEKKMRNLITVVQ